MAFDISPYLFMVFAGLTIGAAITVLVTKEIVRAAFFLAFAFIGVGIIYLFLNAEFVVFAAGHAVAGDVTGDLNVSVTVGASVSLNVTAHVDFGMVAAGAVNKTATGQITVNAPTTVTYKIGLGAGNYLDSGTRRMANGSGGFAAYQLCHDSACGQPWGDKDLSGGTFAGGNPTAGVTGTGAAQSYSVYAVLPVAPTAEGNYTDTVVIRVEW
jgi:spore coat protein U-like protein